MAGSVRPVPAVYESKSWIRDILLDNMEYFRVLACIHEKNLRGLKDSYLGDGFDIGLAVTDLAQNGFRR